MIGSSIFHYRVSRQLGAGGMGEVYLAEDSRLGRPVALKLLAAGEAAHADSRRRLLQEARAASALRSPHIAVIYDIGEHEGRLFIAMEYVEGDPLSTRLERGALAVDEAVDIAAQVADALDEAHRRGIIHRDIKSGNLIVTERGLVKVLDFGLAKLFDPLQEEASGLSITMEQTAAGVVLGTVLYMSPEQALGRKIDHRSDIFSLGVVLYEMLTGRLPFHGAGWTEVMDAILHQEPPPPSRFNFAVPPELDAMVAKAMAKDPDYRFQTARDLFIDLRRFVRRSAGADEERTGRRTSRRTLVPSGSGRAAEPGGSSIAVMTFSNITREPADDWIGTGIAETVTADLKNIQGLSVISRAQIFEAVKNLSASDLASLEQRIAIEVGRRIGAAWIVGGGFQRLGPTIRITSQIVDVRSGELLKTVKIDGALAEIFSLQDKIVYELVKGLNVMPGRAEVAEIEEVETYSVEAYESYARGMMNLRDGSREALDRAIALFERATEQDPKYAEAWSALARAYSLKGAFLSLPELLDRGIVAARRAISLDPRLASAYAALGAAYGNRGQYDQAIDAITEAVRLEPDNPAARAALGRVYWMGKGLIDEGIAELEVATEMNVESGYALLQLGLLYALRGEFGRAEAASRKAIELQEQYVSGTEGLQIVGAHLRLGYALYRQGRYQEAIREYEREIAFLAQSDHVLRERTFIEANQKLGAAYFRLGRMEDAERHFGLALKRFEARLSTGAGDPFTNYYIAALHGLRGDAERAARVLEDAFGRLRALNQQRARQDPDFDSVRDHPAVQRLLEPATVTR